jgi:hypothetical protein
MLCEDVLRSVDEGQECIAPCPLIRVIVVAAFEVDRCLC